MFSMVIYACVTREQFYPIILLLVNSKVSFLLISNMIFAFTLLFGQILIKLFFGSLRDVEYELIMERAKYSITETCLALTIFRNDLSPSVFAFFLLLLFLKIFHWLSRSRLVFFEQVYRV
jgi:E3 ubiquitin-protein ligase synoviolin